MTPALQVRGAKHADVAELGRLWLELMHMHEQRDARFALADDALDRWRTLAHDMIGRDDAFLLVCEEGARPMGFCLGWLAKNPSIYRKADVGFISELAVTATARRRGVGRALVGAARVWFVERGLDEFQLSTAVWNDEAQAFWLAVGGEPLLLRYRFPVHTS